MYSQGDEEAFIVSWFTGRKGRFLDVGASDGVRYSNTRRLSEIGWRGVLVEPNPSTFSALLGNYQGQDGIACVNCAVAPKGEVRTFWASVGEWIGISSLNSAHVDQWRESAGRNGTVFLPMWLRTISPDELIDAFPGPFTFVTIDAEGASWSIAKAMPWSTIGAELICVEIDYGMRRVEMDEFFARHGYALVYGDEIGNAMYGTRRIPA